MPKRDVVLAAGLSADMIRWELRGSGDTAGAIRRVADRIGIPHGKIWALRYRQPKAIASHILDRIKAAHAREVERQLRKLAHEAEITTRLNGPADPAVLAAVAVLRAHAPDLVSPELVAAVVEQGRQ